MKKIADIIGPIYQNLLTRSMRKKFSANIDIQDPFLDVGDAEVVEQFYEKQIKRAIKTLDAGGTITMSQTRNDKIGKFSLKDSGPSFSDEQKEALREEGLEFRSRFGYDNTVSLVMEIR